MFMHMHGRGCGHRDGHHAAMGGVYGGGRGGGRFAFAWGPGEGERPGGGRQRRMFDAGELRLVLLRLIADSPRHGYDLIRAIEERTAGAYAPSPGVIYPMLTMLDDMALIEEAKAEGTRKLFAASEGGRAELASKAEEVAALFARLDALGADLQELGQQLGGDRFLGDEQEGLGGSPQLPFPIAFAFALVRLSHA